MSDSSWKLFWDIAGMIIMSGVLAKFLVYIVKDAIKAWREK